MSRARDSRFMLYSLVICGALLALIVVSPARAHAEAGTGEIHGRAFCAANGQQYNVLWSTLYRKDAITGEWAEAAGSASTDESGYYRFSGLPAGTYRVYLSNLSVFAASYLEATPAWYPDAETSATAGEISLADAQVVNADVTVYPIESLTVHVRSALSGREVTSPVVHLWEPDGIGGWVEKATRFAPWPDTFYRFSGPFRGFYRVTVTDASGKFMPGSYGGRGPDIGDADSLLFARGEQSSIDVTLTPVTGALSGTVRDSQTGAPIPFASVGIGRVAPGPPATPQPAPFAYVTADAGGSYTFPALEAGYYRLVVTEPAHVTVGAGSAINPVTVAPGGVCLQDVSMVHRGKITGLVRVEQTSAPLSGIRVDIHSYALDAIGTGPPIRACYSHSDGTIDTGWLDPGAYWLTYTDPSGRTYDTFNRYAAPMLNVTSGGTVGVWPTLRAKIATTFTTTASASTVNYNGSVKVSSALLAGRYTVTGSTGVTLWQSTNGGHSYSRVATASYDPAAKRYVASARLQQNTILSIRFAGDGTKLPCSTSLRVSARASLGAPTGPTSSIRKGSNFTYAGSLKPKHSATLGLVKLYFYHYEAGRWVLRKTVAASLTTRTYDSWYHARTSLPYVGKWRVRAYHADTSHAATYSAYRYVTVK